MQSIEGLALSLMLMLESLIWPKVNVANRVMPL